jgi:nucleotide-binding universal stress UspA family protein
MFKRIIIGYDDSAGARAALVAGRKLAEIDDAEICVLYVYPYEPVIARGDFEVLLERVRSDADAIVERARPALGDFPKTEFLTLPGGSPAAVLHSHAARWGADLIVVGGSPRNAHLGIGAVAEQTLHASPCAVLVAPADRDETIPHVRTIGVAFDGSREAHAALDTAAELAGQLGCGLEAIDVVEPAFRDYPFGWTFETDPDYAAARCDEASQTTHRAVDACGHPARATVVVGDPVRELVERSRDLDLIVAGSRAYGPVRRLMLGSVSTRLVRDAKCPVLVLPRGAHIADETEPVAVTAPDVTPAI